MERFFLIKARFFLLNPIEIRFLTSIDGDLGGGEAHRSPPLRTP